MVCSIMRIVSTQISRNGTYRLSMVLGMGQMFYYASAFNHDVSGWRGLAAENSQWDMFYGATAFIDKYLCAEVHRNWNTGSVMPSNCTTQNSTWVSPSPPPPSSSPPPSPPLSFSSPSLPSCSPSFCDSGSFD